MEINDVIDNLFRVEKYLGSGASGKVYLVSLKRDWNFHKEGAQFALKFYNDEIFEKEKDDVVYSRRIREATLGNKINSANVIRTFDTSEFWIEGNKPRYLLMELINGEQLDLWVKKNSPLPIDRIYEIAVQTAEGLKSLHSQNIIHRDVKPANVIITSEGRLILLDLGVIRPLEEGTITGSESFLGTLRFGAPEWLIESRYSDASDIYSFGTILYLLLNGHDIFPEIELFSRLVIAVERDIPESNIENNDPQRAYLVQLVNKMLDKNPNKRPSLDSVIEFLKSFAESNYWKQLRKERILELLPYLKSNLNRNYIIQILTSQVDLKELDIALAGLDKSAFDRLIGFDVLQNEIASLKTNGTLYLNLSDNERIAWVKKAFAVMDAYYGWDDGGNIEEKSYLASRISKIEKSTQVLSEIEPLLNDADAAMTEMIQVLAQENP